MRTSALRNATANPKPTLSRRAGEFNPLHFLLLLSLALGGTALLAAVLLRGIEGVEFETFLFLLAIYAAAAVSFLIWQARSTRLRFFDIPVFLTITCFIRFGLVPLSCFLNPQ